MTQGIGWINLLESATLSDGDWESSLPLNNMKTRELADVARTVDASVASTRFIVDHGSAKSRRAAAFKFHNAPFDATVTWSLGTTPEGAEVATLAKDCWQITPTTYNGRRHEVILVLPQSYSARYDLFEFDIDTTDSMYLEIAYAYVCDPFIPSFGIDTSAESQVIDRSGSVRARSGVPWIDAQRKMRGEAVNFPRLVDDEGDTMHELMLVCGTSEPVLWLPSLEDMAAAQRYGFIGSADELRGLSNPFPRGRGTSLRLTEW